MLDISRKDICRRTLPIPDFNGLVDAGLSSAMIFCVRGRGFGRAGVIAPALRLRSDRKDSLSEANLSKALSKSKSVDEGVGDLLGEGAALIVMLLRLLLVPFGSTDRIDKRASADNLDRRLEESRLLFLESPCASVIELRSSSGSASS
jgi:hypothetical protein